MTQPIFIVSTGRTGTEFLSHFFREAGFNSLHEPGPFYLRHISHAHATNNLSSNTAKRIIRRTRQHLYQGGNERYIESSCLIYGLVRPLLEEFPNSQVIQLVRDPRTYIRSAINWGAYRFMGRPLNLLPFRRLALPQYHPRSLPDRIQWIFWSQFDRLAWAWAAMNRSMREQGQGNPRFHTIRFEDLFDNETRYSGLQRLCEIAGTDIDRDFILEKARQPLNKAPIKRTTSWQHWPPEKLARLSKLCNEEATHYGYELAREINDHCQ